MQTTVLLLVVAVALCGAHHIHIAEKVTCSGEGHVERAAHLAVHHINDNHHHGYAFNLTKVISSTVVTEGNECTITLELSLEETKCHFTNPKHYEDCELRRPTETEVTAECKVVLHFRAQGASVHSYRCDTKQDETLRKQCPDCPILLPLNNTAGLSIVHRAVRQYNVNNATEHYFVLRDVGRIKTAYVPGIGNFYITEFAMVETHCRTGTRIAIKACRPLCPDRARHVFCSATGDLDAITDLDCETYPAVNHTELAIGEREPLCPYHYEHATLPSHERIHLIEEVHPAPVHEDHPAPSAAAHGDHPAHSAAGHNVYPARTFHCIEKVEDPAIHTICDWPRIPLPQ